MAHENDAHTELYNGGQGTARTKIEALLHDYSMDNVQYIVPAVVGVTVVSYLIICGLLHWWFYYKQRNTPEEWKCQPKKFVSRESETRQAIHSFVILTMTSAFSGVIVTYIMNGGRMSKLYFGLFDYGYTYLVLSTVLAFVIQEGAQYYLHRFLHIPCIYKRIHYLHHKVPNPTAFNALYIHPFEAVTFQLILISPAFLFPMHYGAFFGCMAYVYYYGVITHSGVDMKALWPWQPAVRFHDNHHKHFHVNYGFNLHFFDQYHGTWYNKKN